MTSLRFDLSSILKILNLSLLWFIERSGSENHGIGDVLRHISTPSFGIVRMLAG